MPARKTEQGVEFNALRTFYQCSSYRLCGSTTRTWEEERSELWFRIQNEGGVLGLEPIRKGIDHEMSADLREHYFRYFLFSRWAISPASAMP